MPCPLPMRKPIRAHRIRSPNYLPWYFGLALVMVCHFAAATATPQPAPQTEDVELVQRCYNNVYNATPSTLSSFMSSWPVSLNVSQVWTSVKACNLSLTVFSTATMDRLQHLESLCQMLPGSTVSAAVYLPLVQPRGVGLVPRNVRAVHETRIKLQELYDRLESRSDTCGLRLLLMTEITADRALAALVPINALRNAALLAIRTPLVAMIDVDLAVSDSLQNVLQNADRVQAMQQAASTFWVLPAWEAEAHLAPADAQNVVLAVVKDPCPGEPLANLSPVGDKQRLSMLWQSRHLRIFSDDIFPQGHNATEYPRWLSTDQPYPIRYGRGYEPWGITARERYMRMPYDARFRGCFRDKVTQLASLAYSNTTFAALPDAWLVHRPHQLSPAAAISVGRARSQGGFHVQALQQVVFYRGINTTKFMLHKAHSLVTSDEALSAMASGHYEPIVGSQFHNCRTNLPWF